MIKQKIITIISIAIVVMVSISILKINNTSKIESLDANNNQENIKDSKETDELETQQSFELENNELNEQLEKQDDQGEVNATIKFLNPTQQDEDYLNFEVYLNTHSVELDKYNLGEITTLSIENKINITEGIEWETVGGGHHVSGTLKIPREYKGEKINYSEVEFIELEVKDLADISSRKFKWEKTELQLEVNN